MFWQLADGGTLPGMQTVTVRYAMLTAVRVRPAGPLSTTSGTTFGPTPAIVCAGGAAMMVSARFAVPVLEAESVTVTVRGVADAAAEGVPEMYPLVALRVSPPGSVPLETDQV